MPFINDNNTNNAVLANNAATPTNAHAFGSVKGARVTLDFIQSIVSEAIKDAFTSDDAVAPKVVEAPTDISKSFESLKDKMNIKPFDRVIALIQKEINLLPANDDTAEQKEAKNNQVKQCKNTLNSLSLAACIGFPETVKKNYGKKRSWKELAVEEKRPFVKQLEESCKNITCIPLNRCVGSWGVYALLAKTYENNFNPKKRKRNEEPGFNSSPSLAADSSSDPSSGLSSGPSSSLSSSPSPSTGYSSGSSSANSSSTLEIIIDTPNSTPVEEEV